MDGFLTRFLSGAIFNDPLVSKLLLLIIFFLGASQVVRIVHGFWKTGQLKIQEKQVEEQKGKWKEIVEQLVEKNGRLIETITQHDERAQKIHDKINWLYEVHHKFDDDGVPLWYVRKSLEKVIVTLSEAIVKQTEILDKISQELLDQKRGLQRIDDRLSSPGR